MQAGAGRGDAGGEVEGSEQGDGGIRAERWRDASREMEGGEGREEGLDEESGIHKGAEKAKAYRKSESLPKKQKLTEKANAYRTTQRHIISLGGPRNSEAV